MNLNSFATHACCWAMHNFLRDLFEEKQKKLLLDNVLMKGMCQCWWDAMELIHLCSQSSVILWKKITWMEKEGLRGVIQSWLIGRFRAQLNLIWLDIRLEKKLIWSLIEIKRVGLEHVPSQLGRTQSSILYIWNKIFDHIYLKFLRKNITKL